MTKNMNSLPASLLLTLMGGVTLGALAMSLLPSRKAAAGPFPALGQPATSLPGTGRESADMVVMHFI